MSWEISKHHATRRVGWWNGKVMKRFLERARERAGAGTVLDRKYTRGTQGDKAPNVIPGATEVLLSISGLVKGTQSGSYAKPASETPRPTICLVQGIGRRCSGRPS